MRRFTISGIALLAIAAAVIRILPSAAERHERKQVLASPLPPAAHRPVPFTSRSPSPVTIENRLPGTRAWHLDRRAGRHVAGFAAPASVPVGGAVRLFVATKAATVRADVFRIGWYRGAGARLVGSLGDAAGDPQTPCRIETTRFTVECRWRPTFTLETSPRWVSGEYLVKLTDAGGSQSYIPFTVREAVPRAPVLLVSAITTWQAYNMWGGRSLYRGPHVRPCEVCRTRSRAVSFDRPYVWPGAGGVFGGESQTIALMESKGIDAGYATSADLHDGDVALEHRSVFVSAGHDEYYSRAMRSALVAALSGGTSLAFLGANDLYRHIRFEPSPLGHDRVEVNYKSATLDPYGRTDPNDSTGSWRNPPTFAPEQELLGAQYDCCPGANHCPGYRFDWMPAARPPWLFRGTKLRPGARVAGLIAGEYDRVYRSVPQPPGVVVVAHTQIPCGSHPMEQDTTFYVAPSGGGVFDAGDEYFACAFGGASFGRCAGRSTDPRIERLTWNLLDAMLRRHFA